MRLRLLLTSALLLFAQIPTMQAQVTVDVAKITCEQIIMQKLSWTSRDVVLWLNGYYHGRRDSTIVDPQTAKENSDKVNTYCYQHGEATVMDAAKNVLGNDK